MEDVPWEQHETNLTASMAEGGRFAAWHYWQGNRLGSLSGITFRMWSTGVGAQHLHAAKRFNDSDLLDHLTTLHDNGHYWRCWQLWARRGGMETYGVTYEDFRAEIVALREMGLGLGDLIDLNPEVETDPLHAPPEVLREFFDGWEER